MLKNALKTLKISVFFMLLLGGGGLVLLLSSCDSLLGLGKPVDLLSPELVVSYILLADGEEKPIQTEDNKIFVGPGILFGKGAKLVGLARDNETVEQIHIVEIGENAPDENGEIPEWTTSVSPAKNAEKWQEWSIDLEGIRPGERVIKITAVDRPGNIGLDTVQQLTLLVDVHNPIVEKISIERKAGYQVDLLPRSILQTFDVEKFEYIDYFQNESFTLRATITHDFSLSNVRLNFLTPSGKYLYEEGIKQTNGDLFYTPQWDFTHDQITEIDPYYATGRHYFSVVITATATAGHSGANIKPGDELTNILYSFCWYPESDFPNISTLDPDPLSGSIMVKKGAVIPVTVFDDDNIGEIYTELLPVSAWDSITGDTDEEKLKNINISSYTNRITSPVNRSVVSISVTQNRGEYKLFTLVRDTRTNTASQDGVWSRAVFDVIVMEEGVPVITVTAPEENTAPGLTNNKFNITGQILNLDAVDFVRIAWVPAGLNMSVTEQVNLGMKVLSSNTAEQGVKLWSLPQSALNASTIDISGKDFIQQTFSFPFDVFSDFMYNNARENKIKTFVIYTQSKGDKPVDVFYTLRLLAYEQPPVINVTPADFSEFKSNQTIPINITPVSNSGLPIASVTLYAVSRGTSLPVYNPNNSDTWTATDSYNVIGDYTYNITATDQMGNKAEKDLIVRVAFPPDLKEITSPHNNGSKFSSRDTVRIHAVFDRAITSVTTVPESARPQILLSGLNNNPRYANYVSGEGSTTLVFEYKPQVGDSTGINVLRALRFTNPDSISATINQGTQGTTNLDAVYTNPLAAKALEIDGMQPTITGVSIVKQSGKANAPSQNFAWHREGEVITFNVTLSKGVRVLRNPRLLLPINNGAANPVNLNRYATFQTTTNNDTVMQFTYKVQAGDSFDASNLTIAAASCFSAEDREFITDKIGGQGNILALPTQTLTQTSDVRVDAIKPVAPGIELVSASAGSGTFRVINDSKIESTTGLNAGTKYQYTTNGGVVWNDFTFPGSGHFTTSVNVPTIYNFSARQVDRAGNEGDYNPFINLSLLSDSQLMSVVCENPSGTYNDDGNTLRFKLIFNGQITSNGTGSIILKGGTGTVNTNIIIALPPVTAAANASSISVSWPVTINRRMDPVEIDSINLNGVSRSTGSLFTADTDYSAKMTDRKDAYNSSRKDVSVLSIKPTIVGGSTFTTSTPIGITSGRSRITLEFDTPVWPERGFITVKPTATAGGNAGVTTGNWLIPPVLTTEEFSKIYNAVSSANKTALENTSVAAGHYVRTTHGLKVEGTSYVPDTDTKYVLNYAAGIDNATLRPILNNAKYLWQEIEVINDKVSGAGTKTITVDLDPLPEGRQWKVEIDADSFRDAASNYFAGWKEAEGAAATNQRWFWSQKVATPVIRVERVSNNAPRLNSNTTTFTLQTNVRYRIDCVTPGAAISYGEYNASGTTVPSNTETNINTLRGTTGGVARITTGAMPNQGTGNGSDPYVANANPGHTGNSAIPDAAVTAIDSFGINQSLAMGTHRNLWGTALDLPAAGNARDVALYTARKDYIGATATRTSLTNSDRGYEGAFKTVIVYREVGDQVTANSGRSLKIEATNTRNGAVTIAGFPMWYNDMAGYGSKYFLRNGDAATNDWIFITWEIVSEFWQVSPVTRDEPTEFPGKFWNVDDNSNSWQSFSANYQVHNYRLYGNWGMQRGNR